MASILVDGSSTAYGFGAGAVGGWADQLKLELLRQSDAGIPAVPVLHNFARPLRSVDAIVDSLPANAAYCRGRSIANIALLQVGMAESRREAGGDDTHMPLSTFRTQLRRLEHATYLHGFFPVLIGMPSLPTASNAVMRISTHDAYHADDRRAFAAAVFEHAHDNGIVFVDTDRALRQQFADPIDTLSNDNLHVNGEAHSLIYQTLLPVVSMAIEHTRDYYEPLKLVA